MSKNSMHCFLCDNKQPRAGRSTCTFHKFPTDAKTHSLWKKFCNLTDSDNATTIRICSDHFTSDDYIDYRAKQLGGFFKLKFDAVPSIHRKQPKFDVVFISEQHISEERSTLQDNLEVGTYEPTTSGLSRIVPSTKTYRDINTQTGVVVPSIIEKEPTAPKRSFEPRYLGDIKAYDIATPSRAKRSLAIAKEVVAKKTRQIKSLQGENRSLKKEICSLRCLVNRLQNRNPTSDGDADNLVI